MAAEYDINLSNGAVLSTLRPLETNGPDNRSTPRLIQRARPTYIITIANPGTNTFTIPGDETDVFRVGADFIVVDSTANNLNYSVLSSTFTSGNTEIITNENFTDATADGVIIAHVFKLSGDVSPRFIAGFTFDVQNSGEIDTAYTVDTLGPVFDGTNTIIPVIFGTIRDNVNTPIALPLGEIEYTITDPNTSLKLPGKGVINYGEYIIENLVRMTEHFANNTPPELNTNIGTNPTGDPLVGQLWYNTTPNEEGFQHYDGVVWTSNQDFNNGAIVFQDVENANTDIYITASETDLPAPWSGVSEPGLVIWTEANPPDNEPIFRVLSVGGEERLRIEHSTAINTGYIRTINNFESVSTGESFFHGKLGIGDSGPVIIDNTLTVAGNGITINSSPGQTAELELNAPLTQKTEIGFDLATTRQGNLTVDDTVTDQPLQLNSLVTNPIIIGQGGGNVGINTTGSPSSTFQIKQNIFFDEGLGDPTTGADIRTTTSGLIAADQTLHINYNALAGPGESIDFRSGTATSAGILKARLNDTSFFVDTDTLYVDSANDRVGINMIPLHPFDVTGTAHFNNPVGINNVPPNGTPVWLEITGDVQVNSQIRGSNQSSANPTFTFINALDMGMYNNAGILSFAVGGNDTITIGTNGLVQTQIANYETLVLTDNDIPNKKFVDERVILKYEEFDAVGGETIINTSISVVANGISSASLQIFVNGILQREGGTKQYTVTGSNQITFTAPLIAADEVLLYSST
jgi:hypothetical protein